MIWRVLAASTALLLAYFAGILVLVAFPSALLVRTVMMFVAGALVGYLAIDR